MLTAPKYPFYYTGGEGMIMAVIGSDGRRGIFSSPDNQKNLHSVACGVDMARKQRWATGRRRQTC